MSQNEIIINAIHTNKEYSEAFREKFPEIFPELLSYTLNKDCSCATRIHEFVKENFDRVNKFYEGFFNISEPTNDWWSPAGTNRGKLVPEAKFEEAPDPITDKYMKELSEKIEQKPIFTPPVGEPTSIKDDSTSLKDVLKSELDKLDNKLDMYGKVVEIGASPDEYTEMMNFARDNNWAYNGINMMETEKLDDEKGTREPIWLAFFY